MFEKIVRCPVCAGEQMKNHLICVDHLVTGESFALTKCQRCNFIYTNPRPTEESIGKYYDTPAYISHSNSSKSLKDRIYKIVRKRNTASKINMIRDLGSYTTLLDYGCGTGYFLQECKQAGYSVAGLEPNPRARDRAELLLEQKIFSAPEDIPESIRWDIITLWHVLEHVHRLHPTMEWLKNRLTKHSRLIMALPNADSYDAKCYKEKWAGYDVPRHLYHFTPDTMKRLLHNHGLKIKKIVPLKYDSYYVSLLSEQGPHTLINYMKGFINGYKSNSYAKKDPLKYSSLIYIVGK